MSFGKIFKKGSLTVLIFLFSAVFVNAGAVLYEFTIPTGATWSNSFWGQGGFTFTNRTAIEYHPTTNQEVCTVKHGVYRFNNPTDNLLMTVKSGGLNPDTGTTIAAVSLSQNDIANPSIPSNIPFYTSFSFSSCLNLLSGTTYFFIFSRTVPNGSNYYASQYMPNNTKPETKFWLENFANGGWAQANGGNSDPSFKLEGADTHEPVLIVPGIAGTELYNGTNKIWADLDQMINFNDDQFITDNLSLNSIGNSLIQISTGNVIESMTHLPIFDVNIFENMRLSLENLGFILNQDLFYFPYDWRLNLDSTKDLLNQKIQAIKTQTGSQKVNIISHSMGGLLVKDYLQQYGDGSLDKLIFIGTPHLGSPKAGKNLFEGGNLDIFWLSKERIKEISRNSPAVYELLPKQEYFSNFTGYIKNSSGSILNYNDTRSFLLNQNLNSTVMGYAETFFDKHLENLSFIGIDTYNIAGCSSATQAGYSLKSDNTIGGIGYTSGDETVPLPSADFINIPSDHKLYLKNASHAEMPSQTNVRTAIMSILSGGALVTGGDLKTNSSECNFSGKTLAWHSPVTVHIYDSQNRHTGPIENNALEENIPGVQYEIIGHEKFVYLPTENSQTYHIVASGDDNGTFDLQIGDSTNGLQGNTKLWNDVPVITGSAVDFNISNTTPDSITVDTISIPKTSTITASQAQDLVVPNTQITTSGTSGSNGWYVSNVTVTLSSSDDNSGIMSTKYSLDGGATYLNYTAPFIVTQEGISDIKYYSIDNAGNNEAIKNLQIKIDKNIPEFNLRFDIENENFVWGVNNPSTISFNCTISSCTATSQGGNQTIINFTKSVSGYNNIVQINWVSYNGVQTSYQATLFNARLFEKFGNFRDFDQVYSVGDTERLKINYFYKKDESKVIASVSGITTKQVLDGKKFLKLLTNQGQINYVIN